MNRYAEFVKEERKGQEEARQRLEEADSVQQLNTHEIDNVYYNVIIDHTEVNYYSNAVLLNPPIINQEIASYRVTRDIPILDKASDYYMAITRFAIPLDNVPQMIMEIIPNQGNANLSPYIICINYLGITHSTHVIYNGNTSNSKPDQNQPTQVITPYYNIYSYGAFLDMVNTALNGSWVSSGLSLIFPNSIPPYFVYNTNFISLIIPDCFHRVTAPLATIPTIYINTQLETYFTAFQFVFNGNNQFDGQNVTFLLSAIPPTTILSSVKPFYPNGITPPALGAYVPPTGVLQPIKADYWKIDSEYNTYPLWNSLRKIVLISNSMPTRPEGIPSSNPNTPGSASGLPILADFIPDIELAGDFQSIAHYDPNTYKLIDLVSDLPLNKIDIQLFWQDRNQNLYPINLSVFQTASIKIGFFRKNLYKDFRSDYGGIKY